MVARGDPSDPEFQINNSIPFDEWDRWNTQRDSVVQRYTSSSRYVPQDVYGAEDLDPYGRWVYDPSYGQVWVPAVDPGWAPYRAGRWVWEDYYGWTWLSADPWGWAPYHWGRWYWGSYGWAWWPGAFGPRYYWSPALVGFFGWGGGVGFSVGFGFGHVGWCPLAPFETFHPWYGRGFTNVNIINNVNIVNNYRNARYVNGVNGVTSMRSNEFGHGAVDARNFVRASAADLRGAGSIQGRMPVTPVRESMRMSERPVNRAGMPSTNANMRFAGRNNFAAGDAGGRQAAPVGGGRTVAGGREIAPAGGRSPAAAGTAPSNASAGGWTRMSPRGGSNPAGSQSPAGQAPAAENRGATRGGFASNGGGWRTFTPGSAGAGSSGTVAPRNESAPGNRGGFGGGRIADPPANAGGFSPRENAAPRGENPGYRGNPGYSASPQRGGFTPQQPVRISPPIVSNRGESGGAARPDVHSGFGTAHSGGPEPRGGGGAGPRGSGGGGGGPRGSGGGGGGNRGGGGGGGGGHRGR